VAFFATGFAGFLAGDFFAAAMVCVYLVRLGLVGDCISVPGTPPNL
jgi:hypothetical protein